MTPKRTDVFITNTPRFDFAMLGARASRKSYAESDTVRNELGERDKELFIKLCKGKDEECKFLRHIIVQMIVRMPRYWWIEFDTYRVGVEMLSESTMYCLTKKEIEQKDFVINISQSTIEALNFMIKEYNNIDNDNKRELLRKIKAFLPEGYLQTRYITTNYQTLRRIYSQRYNHRLDEWRDFCHALLSLPYFDLLVG